MTAFDWCEKLLNDLEAYDEAKLPLGLYASDDLRKGAMPKPQEHESQRIFKPFLNSLEIQGKVDFYHLKFSKIKVRYYGSGYQVDKHEDRVERWKRENISGQISNLWKQPEPWHLPIRAFLLIGFDKAQRPLERELSEFEQSLNWNSKCVTYLTRT